MESITDKPFTLTFKEGIYLLTIVLGLAAQWFSLQAAQKEATFILQQEQALLRLEITVMKAQIEELKRTQK